MASKIFDRVQEFVTTKGTGVHVLSGATPGGFRACSSVLVNNDVFDYCCVDPNAGAWEVATGSYNQTANTVTRTTVTANSLGTTAPINFGGNSGTYLFLAMSANLIVQLLNAPGGMVKVDGTTITQASDGTLSVLGQNPETVDDGSALASNVLATGIVILRIPAAGSNPAHDYRLTLPQLANAMTIGINGLDAQTDDVALADYFPMFDYSANKPTRASIAQIAKAVGAILNGSTTPPAYSNTMTITTPSTMTVGNAYSITVTGGSGGLDPSVTFTPTAPVAGSFSPASASGKGTTALVFAFTPSAAGNGVFSASASGVTATPSANVTISALGGGTNFLTLSSDAAFADRGDNSGMKMLTKGTATASITLPTNKAWVIKIKGPATTNYNFNGGPWLTISSADGQIYGAFKNRAMIAYDNGGGNANDPQPYSVTDGKIHDFAIEAVPGTGINAYADGNNIPNGNRASVVACGGAVTLTIDGGSNSTLIAGIFDLRIYAGSMASLGALLYEAQLNGDGTKS